MEYGVAILVYILGEITGIELAGVLKGILKKVPIVIASGTDRALSEKWPNSIKYFVSNTAGYEEVLRAAMKAADKKSIKWTGT